MCRLLRKGDGLERLFYQIDARQALRVVLNKFIRTLSDCGAVLRVILMS